MSPEVGEHNAGPGLSYPRPGLSCPDPGPSNPGPGDRRDHRRRGPPGRARRRRAVARSLTARRPRRTKLTTFSDARPRRTISVGSRERLNVVSFDGLARRSTLARRPRVRSRRGIRAPRHRGSLTRLRTRFEAVGYPDDTRGGDRDAARRRDDRDGVLRASTEPRLPDQLRVQVHDSLLREGAKPESQRGVSAVSRRISREVGLAPHFRNTWHPVQTFASGWWFFCSA